MAGILRTILRDPGLPERYRDPANWPAPMRREYGDDGGTASAAAHREWLVRRFRHCRTLLDDFRPEVVVIWGDDQYENFTDDVIPPFCVLAYDAVEARHRKRDIETPNVWNEGADTVFRIPSSIRTSRRTAAFTKRCASATTRRGARPRSMPSRRRASRRCSTGTCWPGPWRSWGASPTSASSSRRGRSTPTSASRCSSHDEPERERRDRERRDPEAQRRYPAAHSGAGSA